MNFRPAPRLPRTHTHSPSVVTLLILLTCGPLNAYAVDEDQMGAWYMLFWNTTFNNSTFGLQGDIQYRAWDAGPDMEQRLIRGGVTWSPEGKPLKLTLGYANISSGAFGDNDATIEEHRVYQEALLPQRFGASGRWQVTHRLRLEQRWVENQHFRNRLRYFIGLNLPFNRDDLGAGAVYLALYNELFLNLERDIGANRRVGFFDRNRAYAALGWSMTDTLRLQAGYMFQSSETVDKGQLQLSLFTTF